MLQIHRDSTSVNKSVSGQSIAHTIPHLNAVRRAFIAANLHRGDEVLIRPTIPQAAALLRVSATYVNCALRREQQRVLIEDGVLPLMPPVTRPALPVSRPIQDEDLAALAAVIGADRWLAAAAQAGI
jgi:hypothetical protein